MLNPEFLPNLQKQGGCAQGRQGRGKKERAVHIVGGEAGRFNQVAATFVEQKHQEWDLEGELEECWQGRQDTVKGN